MHNRLLPTYKGRAPLSDACLGPSTVRGAPHMTMKERASIPIETCQSYGHPSISLTYATESACGSPPARNVRVESSSMQISADRTCHSEGIITAVKHIVCTYGYNASWKRGRSRRNEKTSATTYFITSCKEVRESNCTPSNDN